MSCHVRYGHDGGRARRGKVNRESHKGKAKAKAISHQERGGRGRCCVCGCMEAFRTGVLQVDSLPRYTNLHSHTWFLRPALPSPLTRFHRTMRPSFVRRAGGARFCSGGSPPFRAWMMAEAGPRGGRALPPAAVAEGSSPLPRLTPPSPDFVRHAHCP